MTLHVICVTYNRPIALRLLIDSFLLQTDPRWQLHIIHDGPSTDVEKIRTLYSEDDRIHFEYTEQRNGQWGHPNRKMMLDKLPATSTDFVLMTNDDNYYVPKFVEYFLSQDEPDVQIIYCDTVHSYMGYNVLHTRLKQNFVDMGSFIVRVDVAKIVGFKHMFEQADGKYAEECAQYCKEHNLKIKYINRPLFIHN